jgi:hypothetical protein
VCECGQEDQQHIGGSGIQAAQQQQLLGRLPAAWQL